MFRKRPDGRAATVPVEVEGRPVLAPEGASAAAAVLLAGFAAIRETPVGGAPRGPYCLMGVCFDCLAEIDGVAQPAKLHGDRAARHDHPPPARQARGRNRMTLPLTPALSPRAGRGSAPVPLPLAPRAGRGRGPSRSDGRVRGCFRNYPSRISLQPADLIRGGGRVRGNLRHCERSEAISCRVCALIEIASSPCGSSQ